MSFEMTETRLRVCVYMCMGVSDEMRTLSLSQWLIWEKVTLARMRTHSGTHPLRHVNAHKHTSVLCCGSLLDYSATHLFPVTQQIKQNYILINSHTKRCLHQISNENDSSMKHSYAYLHLELPLQ